MSQNDEMRRIFLLLIVSAASLAHAQFGYQEYDDLVYTQASGAPQTLDLFVPGFTPRASRPGIVFVHGGGWTSGSKEDFKGWGQYYAALGYVCVSINYRLAPQYHWPAQIDDTQAAVRWMRKWAPLFRLNPAKIGAVGASAGGHLVLLLGQLETLNDFDPALSGFSSKVQVVADYSGPTDFSNPAEWNSDIWALIQSFIGVPWSRQSLPLYMEASPLTHVAVSNAPMLIFQGDADPVVPVDQARRLVAAMRGIGAAVTYFEFPGQGHGFDSDYLWQSVLSLNDYFKQVIGR